MNEILTVGLPTLAVLIGILVNNSRLSDMQKHLDSRLDYLRETTNSKIEALQGVMNARFDAAHSDLIRVEQVMDARLKHLEENR